MPSLDAESSEFVDSKTPIKLIISKESNRNLAKLIKRMENDREPKQEQNNGKVAIVEGFFIDGTLYNSLSGMNFSCAGIKNDNLRVFVGINEILMEEDYEGDKEVNIEEELSKYFKLNKVYIYEIGDLKQISKEDLRKLNEEIAKIEQGEVEKHSENRENEENKEYEENREAENNTKGDPDKSAVIRMVLPPNHLFYIHKEVPEILKDENYSSVLEIIVMDVETENPVIYAQKIEVI